MKYQTYIETFVFCNPSSCEKEVFSQELEKNPVLREEYEEYLETIELIRSTELSIIQDSLIFSDFNFDPEIELLIRESSSDLTSKNAPSPLQVKIRSISEKMIGKKDNPRSGWLKAAAVLTVCLFAFFAYEISKPSTIDINKLKVPQYAPVVLRGNVEENQNLSKTLRYFLRSQPDSVLQSISEQNHSMNDPLLKPVCLMELNRPSEASAFLKKIKNDNLNYTSALWHLAICDLMLNEPDAAKKVLKDLKKRDKVYTNGINKLLRSIYFKKEIRIRFHPEDNYPADWLNSGIYYSNRNGFPKIMRLENENN